jgi:cytoskeletal protein RodZ
MVGSPLIPPHRRHGGLSAVPAEPGVRKKRKASARSLRRLHLYGLIFWVALILPTVLWWKNSVAFIAFASIYANIVGHAAAYQGARAEQESSTTTD